MLFLYIIHLLYFNLLYEYIKKHYKALLESLKGVVGDEDLDINDIDIINSGIETLKKLKFDDKKWELDASNFIIHHGIYFIILFCKL